MGRMRASESGGHRRARLRAYLELLPTSNSASDCAPHESHSRMEQQTSRHLQPGTATRGITWRPSVITMPLIAPTPEAHEVLAAQILVSPWPRDQHIPGGSWRSRVAAAADFWGPASVGVFPKEQCLPASLFRPDPCGASLLSTPLLMQHGPRCDPEGPRCVGKQATTQQARYPMQLGALAPDTSRRICGLTRTRLEIYFQRGTSHLRALGAGSQALSQCQTKRDAARQSTPVARASPRQGRFRKAGRPSPFPCLAVVPPSTIWRSARALATHRQQCLSNCCHRLPMLAAPTPRTGPA
jgi:hypothetical protein